MISFFKKISVIRGNYLKCLTEVVNATMINPVEIASDGRAGSGTIYNFVATFHGSFEGGGIAYIPFHYLHRSRKHVLHLPIICLPQQRLIDLMDGWN